MNKPLKIFIVGSDRVNKMQLAEHMCTLNDNLTIARRFTTIEAEVNLQNYLLCNEDVFIGYKNNAFLIVNPLKEENFSGIAIDEMYNSDLIVLDIKEFNEISNSILRKNNILVVWLDSKRTKNMRTLDIELAETNHFIDRLNFVKYMYFLDEDPDYIIDVINNYMNGTPKEQKQLLEEFI